MGRKKRATGAAELLEDLFQRLIGSALGPMPRGPLGD